MEIVRIYALPLFLAMGAVLLLAVETRTLQLDLARGAPRWLRVARRVIGALTIAAIGFMLHFGRAVPTAGASEEVVLSQFYYWMWVLGLVLWAIVLALWDVVDSIKTLKHHLEHIERDELTSLQDQIRQRK